MCMGSPCTWRSRIILWSQFSPISTWVLKTKLRCHCKFLYALIYLWPPCGLVCVFMCGIKRTANGEVDSFPSCRSCNLNSAPVHADPSCWSLTFIPEGYVCWTYRILGWPWTHFLWVILPVWMFMHLMHGWCPPKPERGYLISPGTRVTGSYELLCWC